jgi:alkylation response protein AidB-like acyl-CoA dehydrogenase
MQIYDAPLKEVRFLLESFGYNDRVASMDAYQDFDLETAMMIIEQVAKFCTQEALPLNRVGDQVGLKYDPETQSVTTPPGFKALYQKTVAQGGAAITHPVEHGGQGAPQVVGMVLTELAVATNKSFSMCSGLTRALVEALELHANDWLKEQFLPKLVSGEWTGTMCLTEPQCGTDLGLMTTRAEPDGDAFRLTGTKIWITFGEHDMSDNIIHLVLARLPDAPEGIKGISLFLVPKFDLDGARNPIFCTGLEHKMGIHASPTCVMSLEGARGWLVGVAHQGMRAMFTMMNVARILVGQEGVALSEIAYQTALAFAKDRRQGRSLDPAKNDPNAKADNILVHPDVRRMLLNIKSTNEAMRALVLWAGIHLDISTSHPDAAVREASDDLMSLLTPVIKSFLTEQGFQNISDAMQVCGGAGYTTDWSIEQYLRDARIALIYEGTNHIQALDLIGRKLPRGNGRLYMRFNEQISDFLRQAKDDPAMAEFTAPLKDASKRLGALTMGLAATGAQDQEAAAAVASPYLKFFGYTALAFMWNLQARAALARGDAFGHTRLKLARYFLHHVLPEIDALEKIIAAGKLNIMAFDEAEL